MTVLRIRLRDGREIDLSVDASDEEVAPRTLLGRFVVDGELALSDTARVPVADVTAVAVVTADEAEGPGWGPGLQDEDVATALDENYPPGDAS